jgi:hypothetical protein
VSRKKRKRSKGRGKKLASGVRSGFSTTQQAGSPASTCSHKKSKPCNLLKLYCIEPTAEMSGKHGQRVVEIRQGQELTHRACPALLDSGGVFQITAESAANPPRTVNVGVTTEAVCGTDTHPELAASDSSWARSTITQQMTLNFSRPPMDGDGGGLGIWAMLNSVVLQSPLSYPICASTCGVPSSSASTPVSSLSGVIEVYPADQFEFELSLPALLKPESLSFDKKSEGWETTKDEQKKEIKQVGDEASDLYKSSDLLQETGSEGEFRTFFEDLKKQQLGVEDEKYCDQITVKLTQKDGLRELVAPTQDIINLVRAIRSAEYAFKQIEDWIDDFQVGPGVSFKVECQFFAGRLAAKWGYTEYLDDRVFFAYAGGIKVDLVKASVDINAGWKLGGLADAFLCFSGEGTISLNVPEIKKEDPDETPESSVLKPEGELKLSGGAQGALGWAITGQAKFEVTFKADTENFKLFRDDVILGGTVVISREPTYGVLKASCRLLGTTTAKKEFIKGNPRMAEFSFS